MDRKSRFLVFLFLLMKNCLDIYTTRCCALQSETDNNVHEIASRTETLFGLKPALLVVNEDKKGTLSCEKDVVFLTFSVSFTCRKAFSRQLYRYTLNAFYYVEAPT